MTRFDRHWIGATESDTRKTRFKPPTRHVDRATTSGGPLPSHRSLPNPKIRSGWRPLDYRVTGPASQQRVRRHGPGNVPACSTDSPNVFIRPSAPASMPKPAASLNPPQVECHPRAVSKLTVIVITTNDRTQSVREPGVFPSTPLDLKPSSLLHFPPARFTRHVATG